METIDLMWQATAPLKWWIGFIVLAVIGAALVESGHAQAFIARIAALVRPTTTSTDQPQETHP